MVTFRLIGVLYILSDFALPLLSAFPPNVRNPLPVATNKITDIKISCDSENLNTTLTMRCPFKGLLFAKDFAQECKIVGSFSNTITISLPTSGCGVRLSTFEDPNGSIQMFYSVNLVIQQDRYLRQISDQVKTIRCVVKDEAFLIKSSALMSALRSDVKGGQINHRIGRMKDAGWSKELEGKQLEEELNDALTAARAWMEITAENTEERPSDTLQVGETALLTIKSTLPAGIGWRVVECVAHDGLGDSSQKLLDEQGCPLDHLLMPTPTYGPIRPIALMRHQEAVSKFQAFKFPDRDRLHLNCGLQLCRGFCPKVDCGINNENTTIESRTGRTLPKKEEGEILDRLEVFNSVAVLAPEIDDLMQVEKQSTSDPIMYPFSNIPGDKTFCVSPDKMAIAFCILGLIFLIAVVVTAVSLLRSKRQGSNAAYYTRSLFSSSSGGSAFGSKLLLHDSPCLGQSASTSRGMQYGRIL
ncbi:uncharacterized protein LOC108904104 [Anoplophora glabripennis]|uniref:uncharacterized protein LOC108904104 n=1 Tax=Anoplophora glabripennis TaxID=217634 RepID=UPI000873CDD9|nr:uncharacterized protein LOC108904104 [Anoplophora glabripennis]